MLPYQSLGGGTMLALTDGFCITRRDDPLFSWRELVSLLGIVSFPFEV